MSTLGLTSGPRTDRVIQWLLDGDSAIRWQELPLERLCRRSERLPRTRDEQEKSKVKRATPPTQRRGTQIPVRNDRPATRRVSESLRSQVIDFKAEKRGRGVCFLARRRLSWLLQAVLEL